jgi:hypothetical protein
MRISSSFLSLQFAFMLLAVPVNLGADFTSGPVSALATGSRRR